jgi:hypothetical protein
MTEPHLSDEYRSLPSSSLFLYGGETGFAAERLLETFAEFAVVVGANIHSTSFAVGDGELKSLTLANLRRRISEKKVQNLSQLGLHSFYDRSDLQSDVFAVGLSDSSDNHYSELILTQGNESFRHKVLQNFLRAMLSHFSPAYGYSVDLAMYYAPGYFAHGMLSRSLRAEKEAHAWQEAYSPQLGRMDHMKGKFRHVFLMNVLSPSHLKNRIGGKSFEDWAAESGHGRLEQWKKDVWVWFVPREDRIRCAKILQFNGLLTAPEGFENELIG